MANNIVKKAYLILGLILISFICLGCSYSRGTGKFYKLVEAYENNFITRDDLLNIAYYYNDEKNINDPDFTPKSVSMDELDKRTITEIKYTHLNRIIEEAPTASIEGIHIHKYFGSYNDYVVLLIIDDFTFADIICIDEYEIDGVKFLHFKDGYPMGIEVWTKGEEE